MANYSTILFDFGGVLAAEGFREGLKEIGRKWGRDPEEIYSVGKTLVYASGYVVGAVDEARFWTAFRQQTDLSASDHELRREILSRFVPRREMFAAVRKLRQSGHTVAILSDQTNWLDELNDAYRFFADFDRVFNSYHHGRSKKDRQFFVEVMGELRVAPREALFLDDDQGNLQRALTTGIRGILVEDSFHALRNLGEVLEVELPGGADYP